ncbi:unnamed protein product [Ectocarpus fasciculatus]
MGMAVGVAHPSPMTCERWGQVLRAAGAQTVRAITGDPLLVLLPPEEEPAAATLTNSPSRGTRSCSWGRRTAGPSSSSLQPGQLAGLDCVLCDFPGAWNGPGGGDDGECRAAATGRRGNGVPAMVGTTTNGATASSPPLLSSLGLVLEAAKLEGVPVVALSWAIDCVVRGTRVRQQARPEYLAPFLDASAAAAPPSSRSPSLAGGTGTRLLVVVSRGGTRYEVSDHVYFSSAGRGRGGGGGGSGSGGPNGGDERCQRQAAVGRIVHLERAGGSGGRVFATIEPLQVPDNNKRAGFSPLGGRGGGKAAGVGGSSALGGGVLHVVGRGGGGYFASPSADSSVSRGRARRARELKKVVLAEERGGTAAAAGSRTPGRRSWQKVEALDAFLLGRVSVLSAREFDSRRGYCGRDPDVYAQQQQQQQRVPTARASPNSRTGK